jgi:hypothetical protein
MKMVVFWLCLAVATLGVVNVLQFQDINALQVELATFESRMDKVVWVADAAVDHTSAEVDALRKELYFDITTIDVHLHTIDAKLYRLEYGEDVRVTPLPEGIPPKP